MKNFTIAIISVALLWGVGGCLQHGGYQLSGYYADGYPYARSYYGADYYDYPWAYPFGFYSFGYDYHRSAGHYRYQDYRYRPVYHDAHKQTVHKSHDDRRTGDWHLNQGEGLHSSRHQLQNDRPRQKQPFIRDGVRHSDKQSPAVLQRSVAPRHQEQRSVNFRKQNTQHQQANPVMRSERRAGKQDFKRNNNTNQRRLRCADGRC